MARDVRNDPSLAKRLVVRKVADVELSEFTFPPGLRLCGRLELPARLSLVLHGSFSEAAGRRRHELKPLSVTYRPAEDDHDIRFHDETVRVFSLSLSPACVERMQEHDAPTSSPMVMEAGRCVGTAWRLYQEFGRQDRASNLAIEGLTLELLAELVRRGDGSRGESRQPPWLRRVREMLHDQLADPLDLETISQAADVHPAHLSRVFRQQFGCSPGQYVRQLRLAAASRELTSSEEPIAQIALRAGFYDQAHFANAFKKWLGMTPIAFRRARRAR